jgi:hypothetical protein
VLLATFSSVGCVQARGDVAAEPEKTAERTSAPQPAVLEKATALVADIFKSEIEKAKTPLQKRDLAKKLLRSASETKDDPLGRFALLHLAADYASRGGDLPTAALAIDEQARSHDIDALELKLQAAEAAVKAVRFPTQHEAFTGDLLPLVHANIRADRFALARRLTELLMHSATVARKPKLAIAAERLAADVEQLAAEHGRLAEPLARNKAAQAKPADKLALGQFYCFLKGDWSTGLPFLEGGGDGPTSQLAADELAGPTEAADQLKLADAWWAHAETVDGLQARRLRQHAAAWYQKALPQLAGLSAARAKRSIEAASNEDLSLAPVLVATPAEASVATTSAEQIDLLALSSETPLAGQVVGGEWSRVRDGVVSGDSAYVRLALPHRVKGSYQLEVEFTMLGGKDDCVGIILPVRDRQTLLCIDGWVAQGRRTYLCNVNGREAINNASAVRGKLLQRGRLHNANLDVSWEDADDTAAVVFTLDGRQVFTWNGRIADLSLQAGWEMPRTREVGLASYVTSAEFSKVTLIEK